MQTIYLIVGKNIRQVQARIVVNGIAEVQTEVGIREFGPNAYHLTREAAAKKVKKANAALRGQASAACEGPLEGTVMRLDEK